MEDISKIERELGSEVIERSIERNDFLPTTEKVLKTLKKRLEESEETEDESDEKKGDEETNKVNYDKKIECPLCDAKYQIKGITSHIKSEHDEVLLELLKNDDDMFECPFCNRCLTNKNSLNQHNYKNHGKSFVKHIIENWEFYYDNDSEKERDSMFDQDGNLKINKTKKISHIGHGKLDGRVQIYLRDVDEAKTIQEIIKGMTGEEVTAKSGEYGRMSSLLNRKDRYEKGKYKGKTLFGLEEKQVENRIESLAIKEGKEVLGDDHEWQLLVRGLCQVMPEEDEKKEIQYHEFSGEYVGDRDKSPKKVWEMLLTSSNLQKAVKDSMNDKNIRFKPDPSHGTDPRTWTLLIDRT